MSANVGVGAIVVAAGLSQRMGSTDKLFAPICGRPLLFYSLAVFQASPLVDRIALVLSADNLEKGQKLVEEAGFDKVTALCLGGQRRQDSVRAGLNALGPHRWVIVHDGARPLVTLELIQQGLEAAKETGCAIAAVPVADTIKKMAGGFVERTVPRQDLWAAQTPQVFRYNILQRIHTAAHEDATDDAALAERLGYRVKVYMGSRRNLKVTTPEDLALAEALLARGGKVSPDMLQ